MINLLPRPEKKKLLKEFRLRYAVVVLGTIFALEGLMFALFVPSYFTITNTTKDLAVQLAQKKALAPASKDDAQKGLNELKNEIALLKPDATNAGLPPSQLMSEVLSQKPAGIGISAFAYGKSASVLSLQLSGIAATREDLLLFQKLLKDNPHFSDIRYSQSFITKKTDIDFVLMLTVK